MNAISPTLDAPGFATAPVTLFVCGEPMRGDDAVGFAILAALPQELRARIRLVDDGMLDAGMLIEHSEDAACVVVDAVSGVRPGEVVSMPLSALAKAQGIRTGRGDAPSPRSSHLVSVESALALAELLLGEPLRGTLVGVGIRDCTLGAPLSAEVAAAVDTAVQAVIAAVDRHQQERPA